MERVAPRVIGCGCGLANHGGAGESAPRVIDERTGHDATVKAPTLHGAGLVCRRRALSVHRSARGPVQPTSYRRHQSAGFDSVCTRISLPCGVAARSSPGLGIGLLDRTGVCHNRPFVPHNSLRNPRDGHIAAETNREHLERVDQPDALPFRGRLPLSCSLMGWSKILDSAAMSPMCKKVPRTSGAASLPINFPVVPLSLWSL
jgi:hypothetical protein